MKTQFSIQYLEFRELLQNDALQMFQQTLRILAHQGISENKLLEVRVPEISPTFCIYIFRRDELIFILGGHWLRQGEPKPAYLREIKALAANLERGEGLES